jgi:hypothetical protein
MFDVSVYDKIKIRWNDTIFGIMIVDGEVTEIEGDLIIVTDNAGQEHKILKDEIEYLYK